MKGSPALLLVVALAAGVACKKTKEPPVAVGNVLADSADQMMFSLRHLLTNKGLMQAELIADTGYFFDEGTRIELRAVHLQFFRPTGAKDALLTSREGTYNTRQSRMEARKNVVVLSEDGRRLTTPQLAFNQTQNLISSDSAFVLTEPGRRLEGTGFTSDPDMKNVKCLRACRGSAGTVNLPGASSDTATRSGSRPGTFKLPGQP